MASARLCKSRGGATAHQEKKKKKMNTSTVLLVSTLKAIAPLTRAVDSLRSGELQEGLYSSQLL